MRSGILYGELLRELEQSDTVPRSLKCAIAVGHGYRIRIQRRSNVRFPRLDPELGPTHPQERLISAGCAIQNMLLVAHALGLGARLSSGRALYSQQMKTLFGLGAHEQPLCFLSVGTVTRRKPARARPVMADYTSTL